MSTRTFLPLPFLVIAITLTSVAAAGPTAAKQRVAITVHGVSDGSFSGEFVFRPLQAGSLKRDSGTERSALAKERRVVREGQSVKVLTWISTAEGKRGTFVIRERIDNVDAGLGFTVGTGTWTLVRGTGQYAGVTGGGRLGQADATFRSGPWSERREGFLTSP